MFKTTIRFLSIRRITTILSIVLMIFSGSSLVMKGLNPGIDFTGGFQIEVRNVLLTCRQRTRNRTPHSRVRNVHELRSTHSLVPSGFTWLTVARLRCTMDGSTFPQEVDVSADDAPTGPGALHSV